MATFFYYSEMMTTVDKVESIIEDLDICNYWLTNKIVYVFHIKRKSFDKHSIIRIGLTDNLTETLYSQYLYYNADIINVLRLVDVENGNTNWESSDFMSELCNAAKIYCTCEMGYNIFNDSNKDSVLFEVDNLIKKEQFNYTYVFSNNIDIKINKQLSTIYEFDCIGENCPEKTNGSQFCGKTFCYNE